MSLFSDVFSLPVHFEFFAIFSYCSYFAKFVCLLETAEIETGMAEKSSWNQANIRQKLGLVWRNRKKISQITKDYFYLPFFLLIILWGEGRVEHVSCRAINLATPYPKTGKLFLYITVIV
jgi:hypothetical protein